MLVLILGLALFLGVHSVRVFVPAWRDKKREAIGHGTWRGAYSLVSLIGFVLIVWGYGQAWAAAPVLYEPPVWLKHLAALLMLFALVAIMVFALPAGRLKPALKHPMLLAVKLWAVAHLLANGDLASILLFGSFLVWAVLDRISVKRRGEAPPAPGPMLNDAIAVGAAVVLYVLFVWKLHLWLFGALPIATA
ncbi:NnrU family protein [Nitratireductor sp. CAU 1489]|uniref:NnrU family protein n=1 Tax=Nitratireductor arenosus TaxID=2682096 RepID=A0A844QJG2_9HYPH|nr:NnrU family protein [Nitratireductor arenosus]MVA98734.1 NnrU family protein [Nitratireductor arenosus]